MNLRTCWSLGLLGASIATAGESPPSKNEVEAPTTPPAVSSDTLYETGKTLFDTFAPPEIKAQYEFPD